MILLDTHVWVRWLVPVDALPAPLVRRIEGAERVAVSAISCWELGMLVARQRLALPLCVPDWVAEATIGSGVEVIPLDCEVARLAADLPQHHRDPADRLIIATALRMDLTLISLDTRFPLYFQAAQTSGRLIRA